MPGSRTAEPYATSTFSSFGNLHILFHTGSTHAHSYSPWRRVPFAPHLLQHWLLTDIAVRPNRTGPSCAERAPFPRPGVPSHSEARASWFGSDVPALLVTAPRSLLGVPQASRFRTINHSVLLPWGEFWGNDSTVHRVPRML